MRYIKSESKNPHLDCETAVAIGNFDGVHIAHQRIIKKMIDFSKMSNLRSMVLTFRPHTAHLFDKFGSPHLIMDYEEKVEEISKLGVDIVVEQRFDEAFASLSKEEFLYDYLNNLKVRAVFVGYDFSFSRDRVATHSDLREFGRKSGAFIDIMEQQAIGGTKISSTKIRNLLLEGNIEIANQLLGRRYYITGTVTQGKRLGKTIGVATANIVINNRLIPREGVYLTISEIDGVRYNSVSNIGKTSSNKDLSILETHIFDFDRELYGSKMRVEFLRFLRPEVRFGSFDELKETIMSDINNAKRIFNGLDEDI